MSQLGLWHFRGSHSPALLVDLTSTGVHPERAHLQWEPRNSIAVYVTVIHFFAVSRVAFAFVYLATAYVCWLLLKYYQVSHCHPLLLYIEAVLPPLLAALHRHICTDLNWVRSSIFLP